MCSRCVRLERSLVHDEQLRMPFELLVSLMLCPPSLATLLIGSVVTELRLTVGNPFKGTEVGLNFRLPLLIERAHTFTISFWLRHSLAAIKNRPPTRSVLAAYIESAKKPCGRSSPLMGLPTRPLCDIVSGECCPQTTSHQKFG